MNRRVVLTFLLSLGAATVRALDPTWEYAVQASATVRSNPPQITLSWPLDTTPATSFTVQRKAVNETAWGPATTLPGNTSSFTDTNVVEGTLYEYQIIKRAGVTGYGYIVSGINVPLADERGRVILVVDNAVTALLAPELAQFRLDLIGDGWRVAQLNVARTATPAQIRDQIRAHYQADPANTRAVILFGRIPVVKSGNLSVDGHGGRPLACDGFYGDMDGTWADANGDGIYDPSTFPSDIDVAVGRVDFANMPGTGSTVRFPAEEVLLQQYLHKNHDYRHAVTRPARRGIIADQFGRQADLANSASAYRAFSTFVGADNVETVDSDVGTGGWLERIAARDYLWVFGAGGGGPTTMAGLGLARNNFEVRARDFVEQGTRGTFYLLFGSWFVEWDGADNLMRAALAAPDYGLTATWCGRPHMYFHHLAMGETIGHSVRLSQNNTTLYTTMRHFQLRGVHLALLGDPTLRLGVIAPPTTLTVGTGNDGARLTWNASPDNVVGYHVYRADAREGNYTRLTNAPVNATVFTDAAGTAAHHYMVRAIALETSASGTYFNASQAAFPNAPATAPAPQPPAPTPATPTAPAASGGGGGGGGSPTAAFGMAIAGLLLSRALGRRCRP
jgi:hypothetical protein